jgi:cytochrome c oxidase accessory protein FixG
MVATAWMMWDFAYWREQMCIIGCPYGRLQGVLLDRNSLIISYDESRGEPRGKGKRVSLPVAGQKPLGDCVDCNLCANVCPTGIDIRDGLQIECVACAQCIDVCDGVMDKVGLPRGLIRYSSQARMSGEKQRILRPRVIIYSVILVGLLSLLTTLVLTMKPFDLMIMRGKGSPFVVDTSGSVTNTWILKLTNRSDEPRTFNVKVSDRTDIQVLPNSDTITLQPGEVRDEPVRLITDRAAYAHGHIRATVTVTDHAGVSRERSVLLLGPVGGTNAQ